MVSEDARIVAKIGNVARNPAIFGPTWLAIPVTASQMRTSPRRSDRVRLPVSPVPPTSSAASHVGEDQIWQRTASRMKSVCRPSAPGSSRGRVPPARHGVSQTSSTAISARMRPSHHGSSAATLRVALARRLLLLLELRIGTSSKGRRSG